MFDREQKIRKKIEEWLKKEGKTEYISYDELGLVIMNGIFDFEKLIKLLK
jgi:hypothetical protein